MSAVPMTCVVKRSGGKTPVSIGRRCWWRWNQSCEVRKVAAVIYGARLASNQSLASLRRFWVSSSSFYVGFKQSPWNGSSSAWLIISSDSTSCKTLPHRSQKYRTLPTQHRQSLVGYWANSSLAIAWAFTEFFREADFKEPFASATGFRIR